jgi:hypothetical protein
MHEADQKCLQNFGYEVARQEVTEEKLSAEETVPKIMSQQVFFVRLGASGGAFVRW